MYSENIYKNIGENNKCVPDPNNILNLKDLNKIGELINNDFASIETSKLDDSDLANLLSWYNNFKIIYSYPKSEQKLSKKWKGIFEKHREDKGKSDIMGLVEIAIGRLLQNKFEKKGFEVRVRKTTTYDDTFSGLDYILEFFDKDGQISQLLGVDFTISEIGAESVTKNFVKKTNVYDYKNYYKKKYNKEMGKIHRVVMDLPGDLAYSFTNNFFTEVLEKGGLLDNDDLDANLGFAIDDLRSKTQVARNTFRVSSILKETNIYVDKILNKFKANGGL